MISPKYTPWMFGYDLFMPRPGYLLLGIIWTDGSKQFSCQAICWWNKKWGLIWSKSFLNLPPRKLHVPWKGTIFKQKKNIFQLSMFRRYVNLLEGNWNSHVNDATARYCQRSWPHWNSVKLQKASEGKYCTNDRDTLWLLGLQKVIFPI